MPKLDHAVPDDLIYNGGVRVSSVPGSSALTKSSPKSTDGAKTASAPGGSQIDPEPNMKEARDSYETAMLRWLHDTDSPEQEPSLFEATTTRPSSVTASTTMSTRGPELPPRVAWGRTSTLRGWITFTTPPTIRCAFRRRPALCMQT